MSMMTSFVASATMMSLFEMNAQPQNFLAFYSSLTSAEV